MPKIQRFIVMPASIALVDLATDEPLMVGNPPAKPHAWVMTFREFVCGTLFKNPQFGKSAETVIIGAAIRAALVAAEKDGSHVAEIDDADYALLRAVAEVPELGYRPDVGVQLVPFIRAILDAPTTDPRKEPTP